MPTRLTYCAKTVGTAHSGNRSSMRPLLLCICMVASLVPVSAFDQFGPRPPERCEALRQDSCRQFYNNTVVPNKFDHYTQAEAATEMSHYPVQSMNCSDELLFLLCALYFPICTDYSHLLSLPPCRSVCLRVRRRCEPYLVERGYPWPDRLNCERLPERDEANGVVCMSDNRTESSWTPIPTSVPEMGGTSSHEGGGTDEESTRPSTLQECRSPLIPSGSKSDSFAGLSYCRSVSSYSIRQFLLLDEKYSRSTVCGPSSGSYNPLTAP